ncbi:hypothetical protein ACP275_06G152300 [Erythranthe tilingii]
MGCFPACFRRWNHHHHHHHHNSQTLKKIQDQPLSSSHDETATLLAATTESLKHEEEEAIDRPVKLLSESETKSSGEQTNVIAKKEAVFDQSNIEKCTNELITSSKYEKLAENKNEQALIENKMNEKDLFLQDKECVLAAINSNANSNEEEEYSCESSLFSLSIDSRRQIYGAEIGEKEVTSSLKPTEISPKKIDHHLLSFKNDDDDYDKENAEEEPLIILKQSSFDESLKRRVIRRESETAVSLSSWLVGSEKSSKSSTPYKTSDGNSNSPESEKNYIGDRRILGEIKHLNEVSVSCGGGGGGSAAAGGKADNQMEIGTVGRYWWQTSTVNEQRNVSTRV